MRYASLCIGIAEATGLRAGTSIYAINGVDVQGFKGIDVHNLVQQAELGKPLTLDISNDQHQNQHRQPQGRCGAPARARQAAHDASANCAHVAPKRQESKRKQKAKQLFAKAAEAVVKAVGPKKANFYFGVRNKPSIAFSQLRTSPGSKPKTHPTLPVVPVPAALKIKMPTHGYPRMSTPPPPQQQQGQGHGWRDERKRGEHGSSSTRAQHAEQSSLQMSEIGEIAIETRTRRTLNAKAIVMPAADPDLDLDKTIAAENIAAAVEMEPLLDNSVYLNYYVGGAQSMLAPQPLGEAEVVAVVDEDEQQELEDADAEFKRRHQAPADAPNAGIAHARDESLDLTYEMPSSDAASVKTAFAHFMPPKIEMKSKGKGKMNNDGNACSDSDESDDWNDLSYLAPAVSPDDYGECCLAAPLVFS